MSIKELEQAVTNLTPNDQDRLAAYLTVLRQQRDPQYRAELTRRLNDRDPAHWVSLEDLEKRWKE